MSVFSTLNATNGNGAGQRWGNRLTDEDRQRIRLRNIGIANAIREGHTHASIAEQFGVSTATVSHIKCYDMQGRSRPRERKKPATPLLASPARADIVQAEAELKKAQREVLVAEAIVLEARALLLRERAFAIK